jgi:hypothetical protein
VIILRVMWMSLLQQSGDLNIGVESLYTYYISYI